MGVPYDIPSAVAEGSKFLNGVLARVLPEKVSEETAAKLDHELSMALLKGELDPMIAQMRINEEEAKSEKLFVSGWRPAVGWTCVAALAWTYVLGPAAQWWLGVFRIETPPLPVLDYATLSPILLGLLGLGTMRTVEKIKGVVGSGK